MCDSRHRVALQRPCQDRRAVSPGRDSAEMGLLGSTDCPPSGIVRSALDAASGQRHCLKLSQLPCSVLFIQICKLYGLAAN